MRRAGRIARRAIAGVACGALRGVKTTIIRSRSPAYLSAYAVDVILISRINFDRAAERCGDMVRR
jgi:hypothetical protein